MQRSVAAGPTARLRGAPARTLPLRELIASLPAGLMRLLRASASRRRVRLGLACAAVAMAVLAGGFLLLRNSSLTAVEHVRIAGVSGPQAEQIDAALRGAAQGMSTLGVSTARLREAVARFPTVSALSARASFPHSLRIVVSEQPPVAVLSAAGVKTAVAADGTVLGPGLVSSSLPSVSDGLAPAAGQRVSNSQALEALRLLGGAPPALDRLTARVYEGPRGLTAVMDDGLVVYFGDDTRPHAKWLSLARVLADSGSAGASYIDVELPDRPAAGFTSGEGAAGGETTTTITKASRESTVSALAAGLAANSSDPSQASTATTAGEAAAGTSATGESTQASGGEEAAAGSTPSAEAEH